MIKLIGARVRRFWIASILLLGLGAVWSSAPAAAETRKVAASFEYAGKKVRVEIFRPAGSAAAPTALVLHGASGVGQGHFVYPFAQALAEAGVAAAVVRYYDGLDRKRRRDSPAIFEARERIILAAIDYLTNRKDVAPGGVGVYGMSLGGFHALSLGVRDRRVKAVVSLGGALSRHIAEPRLAELPPTLLLHGGRDKIVPFARALATSRAIERFGQAGELKVYPREGHSFSPKAHSDAVESVARFLAEGLRPDRQLAESADR